MCIKNIYEKIDALNHESCQWLQEKVYNGKALKVKANVRPTSLHSTRIAQASTAEDHVKAIFVSGISLSSIFHTIEPTCLGVNEIFVRFEYRERLKGYENEKNAKVLKAKSLEDKSKALIALNKSTYNMTEILAILCWKLGDEYSTRKDKKLAELQLLLSEYANTNPADILLPSAPEEVTIPHIDESEASAIPDDAIKLIGL